MPSGQEQARTFANFSNNVKKTALGVRFTKTLFLEPERLSAKTVTLALKQLGLNIPPGAEIAAEGAQVIVSGQAISTANNAKDLNSATNATATAFRSISAIAEANGMLDSDSASIMRIGTDVAMIVGSGGTNAAAWVSLAMNLANTVAVKQGLADIHAIQNAQDQYRIRVSPQARILGETFKDFQEKKISIYGVIAKMAVETPDLWPQVISPDSELTKAFPELMMIPTVTNTIVGKGSSEIGGDYPWPASGRYVLDRWESEKTLDIRTLGVTFTRESAAEYFFELILKPWMSAYAYANNEIVSRGNMSMSSIASLTYLINPQGDISDRYDYVNMLLGSCLTPYDFDDNMLDNIAKQFVEDHFSSQDKIFHEQAISTGISTANKNWNVYQKDLDTMRAKLMSVKQNDDISELVKYPYIYKKLQDYMDFEQTSFERDPTLGGQLNAKFDQGNVRAWRSLHNYFSVLQMLDTFRKDSYLSQTRYAQQLLPFMPSIESFDQQVSKINYLSTMRSVNRLAMKNIASFIGTNTKNLIKITSPDDMGAVKFGVKKYGN